MNLGMLLRQKRKAKGLTLEQVGKAIGVSKNTVSKYERNMIANMGNTKRLALAKLLDIPPIVFLEAIDELEKDPKVGKLHSRTELKNKVTELVNQGYNLSEQEKALLLHPFNVICSNDEEDKK